MSVQTTIELTEAQNIAYKKLLQQIKSDCKKNFRSAQMKREFLMENPNTHLTCLDYYYTLKCFSQAISEYKLSLLNKKTL